MLYVNYLRGLLIVANAYLIHVRAVASGSKHGPYLRQPLLTILSQPVGRSQAEVERLEREEQQSKAEDPVSSPERMMLISPGEVSDWQGASNISGNPLGVGLVCIWI